MEDDETLIYKHRGYVPNSGELRKLVMNDVHNVPYIGHLGNQNTIAAVRS